jgi:hypothetical protein
LQLEEDSILGGETYFEDNSILERSMNSMVDTSAAVKK